MAAPAESTRCAARPLIVGGLTPLSITDYPDHLAAVVFCQGCPWRCGYCQNPHLLPSRGAARMAWTDVLSFLHRRCGLLEAVVFSGGEPLAQAGLADAMHEVQRMGFRIGLHTGGAYPKRFAEVLPLLDWVGFDVKASFAEYSRITTVRGSGDRALESAKRLIASGVSHEFRTTVHPRQHDRHTLERLTEELAGLGARDFALQEFRAEGCADAALVEDLPGSFLAESWCAGIAAEFDTFALRRA